MHICSYRKYTLYYKQKQYSISEHELWTQKESWVDQSLIWSWKVTALNLGLLLGKMVVLSYLPRTLLGTIESMSAILTCQSGKYL